MPKIWTGCSEINDDPRYRKHANETGSVEIILIKIERIEDDYGQEVYTVTEEKAALASFMI